MNVNAYTQNKFIVLSVTDSSVIENVILFNYHNKIIGVSNNSGIVNLTQKIKFNDTLHFKHVGYKNEIIVYVGQSNIFLTPKDYSLNEVTILSTKTPSKSILEKAISKYKSERNIPIVGKGYLTIQTESNNEFLNERLEAFYITKSDRFGILSWYLSDGRYFVSNKDNLKLRSLDFSYLIKYFSLNNRPNPHHIPFQATIFNSELLKMSKIKNAYLTTMHEFDILVYVFEANNKKIKTQGEIWIRRDNLEIIYLKHNYLNWNLQVVKPQNHHYSINDFSMSTQLYFESNYIRQYDFEISYLLDNTHKISTSLNYLNYSNLENSTLSLCIDNVEYINDYNNIFEKIYTSENWTNQKGALPLVFNDELDARINDSSYFLNSDDVEDEDKYLIENGYERINSKQDKETILLNLNNIQHSSIYYNDLVLTKESILFFGITSKLLVRWNCTDNKLFFKVLPIIDKNLSWIDSTDMNDLSFQNIFNNYVDLLIIQSKKLELELSKFNDCENTCDIIELVQKYRIETKNRLRQMASECWAGFDGDKLKGAYIWKNTITKEKKELLLMD